MHSPICQELCRGKILDDGVVWSCPFQLDEVSIFRWALRCFPFFFPRLTLSKRTKSALQRALVVIILGNFVSQNIPLNESLSNIADMAWGPKTLLGLQARSEGIQWMQRAIHRCSGDATRDQRLGMCRGGVVGKVGSQQNALGGIDRVNHVQCRWCILCACQMILFLSWTSWSVFVVPLVVHCIFLRGVIVLVNRCNTYYQHQVAKVNGTSAMVRRWKGEGLFSEKMLRESINWLKPFATCHSTMKVEGAKCQVSWFWKGQYITKQLQCIRNFKVLDIKVFRNFQHEVCVPIKTSQKACAKTFFRRA